jgi:hypothetical protein
VVLDRLLELGEERVALRGIDQAGGFPAPGDRHENAHLHAERVERPPHLLDLGQRMIHEPVVFGGVEAVLREQLESLRDGQLVLQEVETRRIP